MFHRTILPSAHPEANNNPSDDQEIPSTADVWTFLWFSSNDYSRFNYSLIMLSTYKLIYPIIYFLYIEIL